MKRSTKIISAVVVTVAIVTGGVAYAGKHARGDHEEHAEYAAIFVAKKLDLDTTQKQALDTLMSEMVAAKQRMQEQMVTTKSDVRALVEAESFDQAKALEMVTGKTATVNEVAPELVVALGNFMDSLNAEQKAEIVEFMDSRKGRRGHWRH